MKLSVGILTYTLDPVLRQFTQRAIKTFKPCADELIVVENGGEDVWEADIFVHYKKNQGYTRGVNTILKVATGDYIAFVSNDIALLDGDLHDLCIPDTVVSPDIHPINGSGYSGAMFVIPRNILEQVGYLDEGMVLRYSDTEYNDRLIALGIKTLCSDKVLVDHVADHTITKTFNMSAGDEDYYRKVTSERK